MCSLCAGLVITPESRGVRAREQSGRETGQLEAGQVVLRSAMKKDLSRGLLNEFQ